jgi:hypothetical protein
MQQLTVSPKIEHLSWGCLQVEGQALKDAKLFPGGYCEWDWNRTGTRHVPGIQPADVEELLECGATTVILSKGMLNRLQVCPETLQILEEKNIVVHVLQTQLAMELYNHLAETEKVGGLFHSTC